jgi:predicted dehydrogenase
MRCLIVGLGTQGKKRLAVAGADAVATVDPVAPGARFQKVEHVPLDSFDAALVCTSDQSKLPILRYLLANGKHVLVEKPLLAADQAQLRELADIARRQGAACYTAYNHRFEPHIIRLKQILDAHALGTVYLARFFYGNGTARDVQRSPWRDQGLGVLSDLGSHLLDLTLFFFGQPRATFEGAVGGQAPFSAPEDNSLMLKKVPDPFPPPTTFEPWSLNCFENRAFDHVVFGARAKPALHYEISLLSWRNTFAVDVIGELGSAHIHGLCKWGPSTFTLRRRVFPSGKPHEDVQVIEAADPTWAAEYQYFKELCTRGGSNIDNDVWISSVLSHTANLAGEGLAA